MAVTNLVLSTWLEAQRSIYNSWQRAMTTGHNNADSAEETKQSFDRKQDFSYDSSGTPAPGQVDQHPYLMSFLKTCQAISTIYADAWHSLQPSLLQPWQQPNMESITRLMDPFDISRYIAGIFNVNPDAYLHRGLNNSFQGIESMFNHGQKMMESYWKMLIGAPIAPATMGSPLALQSIFFPMLRALMPVSASFLMPGMQTFNLNQQVEYLLNVQEKTLAFNNKMAEIMAMVFDTAHEAYQQLNQQKQHPGTKVLDNRAAYNEWARVNEVMFTALYAKPAFTRLQDEISRLGVELRTAYQKAFEVMLEPFPVVLRSQPDAYGKQENSDHNRIQQLEEKINLLQEKLMQLSVQQEEVKSNQHATSAKPDFSEISQKSK